MTSSSRAVSTSKRARGRRRPAGRGRRRARPRPSGGSAVSTATDVRVRWRSSPSVPVSTVRPARMIVTRSHSASTSARMWLESRTVRPSRRTSSMHSLEHGLHQRVEARRRLVEHEQLGVRGQRGDERDLLAVALGVACAPSWPGRARSARAGSARRRGSRPPRRRPSRSMASPPVSDRPQADVAGHVGQAPVDGDRVAPRVAAEQGGRPAVGAQQPEQDADRRRLARAVGPEEAVHLPARRPGGRGRRGRGRGRRP